MTQKRNQLKIENDISMIKYSIHSAFLLAFILVLSSQSCKINKESKVYMNVDTCCDSRQYLDLKLDSLQVKVLYFENKSSYDMLFYPCFFIGLGEAGDTLGFVDKDNANELLLGSKVVVYPCNWTPEEKSIYFPLHKEFADNNLNKLMCSVKRVYYISIRSRQY